MPPKKARAPSTLSSSSSSSASTERYQAEARRAEKNVTKAQKQLSDESSVSSDSTVTSMLKRAAALGTTKMSRRPVIRGRPREINKANEIALVPFGNALVSMAPVDFDLMKKEEEMRRRLMTKQYYLDALGPPSTLRQGEYYQSLPSESVPQAQVVHMQPTAYATSAPASVIDLVSESSGQPGYSALALDASSTHSSEFLRPRLGKKKTRSKASSSNSSLSNKSKKKPRM